MTDADSTERNEPVQRFEILYSQGSDSVVLADVVSHDDIAEVFHEERHTVNQTVEQALATARLFAAAPAMRAAIEKAMPVLRLYLDGDLNGGCLRDVNGKPDRSTLDEDFLPITIACEEAIEAARIALADVEGIPS